MEIVLLLLWIGAWIWSVARGIQVSFLCMALNFLFPPISQMVFAIYEQKMRMPLMAMLMAMLASGIMLFFDYGEENIKVNISNLVGSYENHLYDLKGKNDWHFVTISKVDDHTLTWTNRAGASWTLSATNDKTELTVGSDCPYYSQGYTTALVQWSNGAVKSIMGPGNEPYDLNL